MTAWLHLFVTYQISILESFETRLDGARKVVYTVKYYL
jgi:hypothetical protein